MTKLQEVEILKSLGATNHTASGQPLEDNRAGRGLGLVTYQDNEEEEDPAAEFGDEDVAASRPASSSSRAPIGEKAVCPICKEKFSRKQSVKNHLKRTHKISLELVKKCPI